MNNSKKLLLVLALVLPALNIFAMEEGAPTQPVAPVSEKQFVPTVEQANVKLQRKYVLQQLEWFDNFIKRASDCNGN